MEPVLETIDLKMVYHVGKVDVAALRGATLQVQPGEYVAIMGPSGCGKSTFLHIVGGMLKPTSGRIIIEGEDLTAMSDAERTDLRRRKIGFVFQRFNLFPTLTAEGNLKLAERIYAGRNSQDAARRRDVLRLVVGQGMKMAMIGALAGLIASLALTRFMKGLLFGVSASDPLTFAAVALLLTMVASLASWIPARRATKVDPMVALRCE